MENTFNEIQEKDLRRIRTAAAACQACPLWRHATQTVFGAGTAHAQVMLIGEQPGDEEDLRGQPFVGPAGRLLERALNDAVIDRGLIYITNAVKHFKWEPRGKRRIHKTPRQSEINACRPWLEREIGVISPKVIVCLGATAAKAIFGMGIKILQQRGNRLPVLTRVLYLSLSILRLSYAASRQIAMLLIKHSHMILRVSIKHS